jgi:hypothetical protein
MTTDPLDPAVIAHRINALEHDSQQHARIITEALEKVGKGFSDEQIAQIRSAFRDELADAGLRLDDAAHQDLAREDFRFLRRLRLSWDGAVSRIGNAVLLGIIAVGGTIIGLGFWAWLSSNLHK